MLRIPIDASALMAHDAFVRALARKLVANTQRAENLAQATRVVCARAQRLPVALPEMAARGLRSARLTVRAENGELVGDPPASCRAPEVHAAPTGCAYPGL